MDRGKQGKTEGLLLLPIALSPNLQGTGRLAHDRVNVADKTVVMPPKETAYGSIEVAVQALKRGASDYFSKPWDNEKLLIEIERTIARRRGQLAA